jgi:hypothetical protein
MVIGKPMGHFMGGNVQANQGMEGG